MIVPTYSSSKSISGKMEDNIAKKKKKLQKSKEFVYSDEDNDKRSFAPSIAEGLRSKREIQSELAAEKGRKI